MSEPSEDELPLSERVRFRRRHDPVRQAAEAELRRRYEAGATILALSDDTGLSYWCVREGLKRAGATLRKCGPVPVDNRTTRCPIDEQV